MGWKNDLFCCHKDLQTCVITWFVPCWTYGKVWQKLDENCIKCGVVSCIPCVNIWFLAKARESVRQKKGIDGSFLMDGVLTCFCGGCVLCQAATEVDALDDWSIQRS